MGAIRSVFMSPAGGLRMIWRLMIAAAAWYALSLGAVYGIGNLLVRLLGSWGVNAGNLHLCPRWVQYLVTYQTGIYSALTAVVVVAASFMLTRGQRLISGLAKAPAGFLAGAAAAALPAGLFLVTDSMRIYTRSAGITADTFISLALCILTALAASALAFGYMRGAAEKRGGRPVGYLCAVIMFIVADGMSAPGAVGVINLILMAVASCFIAEKYGIWASAGLHAGFMWTSASVFGFTGSENAVVRLYPVSEKFLTGGESGLMSGFITTLILGAFVFCTLAVPLLKKLKHAKISRK